MASESFANAWIMRLGLGLFVLMIVSLFQSCQELRYAVGGKEAQVVPQSITESHNGRRGGLSGYAVWFNLDPPGGQRIEGHVSVGINEVQNFQVGIPIDIQYIGSDTASFDARLKGRHRYGWVGLFFFFLITLIGSFVWGCIQWNRTNAAEQRGSRGRKR